jgi:mycothiol synthase
MRSLLAGEERAVYEAHMETFEDSWEHVREPYEQWSHMLVERPEFEPGLWLLAVDGDRIAGIALSMIQQHQPTTGRIMIVGVRREWRRQGLGEALLRASFAALSTRGCTRAILGVDAESLTGAHRLYERAGMHVVARFDVYERG